MAFSAGAVTVDIVTGKNTVKADLQGLAAAAKGLAAKIGAAINVAALARLSKRCIELASDLNEVQNVVDVTFKSMSASVDAWAKQAAESFGLSETMAKRYAGTFGSMAEAFGFTEQQAYVMGTKLTELAGDVASFYNITQDVAYTKLKSVFSGETESLKELGIVMTQANLDQYALANGFGMTTSAMSEQQKVVLRYMFVQNALSNAAGDFSRTSGSWANQVRLLTLRFGELAATIGQSLIAVLLPVVRGLNAIVKAATNAANAFNRMIEAITGKSMAVLTGADEVSVSLDAAAVSAGALSDGYDSAASSAGGAAAAQNALNRALAGFDKINKLSSSSGASGGGSGGSAGGGGTAGLGDLVATEVDTAQTALDKLELPESLISAIQRFKESLEYIAGVCAGGLTWAWENVFKPLGEWTLDEAAPRALEAVGKALELVFLACEKLSPILTVLWDDVVKPLGKFLGDVVLVALDALNAALDWLLEYVGKADFSGFAETLHEISAEVGEDLATALDALGIAAKFVWENVLQPLGTFLFQPFPSALDAAKGALDKLKGAWDGLKDGTKTLVAVAKEKVAGALDALKKKWDSFKDKTAEVVARVKDGLSNLKTWWADAKQRITEKVANVKAGIAAGLQKVKDWWANAKTSITNKLANVKAGIAKGIKGVKDWWAAAKTLITNKAANVKANVAKGLQNVRDWWAAAKVSITDKLANVKAGIEKGLQAAETWWKGAKTAITEKTANVRAYIADGLQEARTWWLGARTAITEKVANVKAGIASGLQGAWSWWQDAKTKITEKSANVSAGIRWGFTNLSEWLADAQAKLGGYVLEIGTRLSMGVSVFLENAKDIANGIIGWINSKLNTVVWPDWVPGIGGNNILPWNPIPYFAQGGFVGRNTPTLAVIGDNRREGEIVSPESKFQAMLDKASANGGTERVEALLVQLIGAVNALDTATYLDGRDITRTVVGNINRQVQSTGASPLLV